MLSELHKAAVFSKIDLREGYHQLELHSDSRHITAFATHTDIYRHKTHFWYKQRIWDFPKTCIELTITECRRARNMSDDILVWGKNQQKHNKNLQNVLQKPETQQREMYIQYWHHRFRKTQTNQLWNLPDKSKIDAIKAIKQPTNATEIRSFLGLVNFCSRFISNYSTITKPLRRLTKKQHTFTW